MIPAHYLHFSLFGSQKMLLDTISDVHKARFGYKSYKVHKMYRFQNPGLWGHYFLHRQEIARKNDCNPTRINDVKTGRPLDSDCNEYFLFHGLNQKILDKILEAGFDERVSNLAGMFGCGIYFAEDSSKSSQYSHSSECAQIGAVYSGQGNACTCATALGEERCMLVCRVVMGSPAIQLQATNKEKPLRRPPEREDGTMYDSVLGESRAWDNDASLDFREYIVYDRRQCYPEYVILYSRC